MRHSRTSNALAGVALAAFAACGSGDVSEEVFDGGQATEESRESAGIPVEAPGGPIDKRLAERGETLYNRRGCVGCHTIGKGRLTGPDLAEVESWRDFEWFYHMVTNPDSMTRYDPRAKRLLQEYGTPMPDLNIQPDEVRALYEYIRHESAEAEAREPVESDLSEAERVEVKRDRLRSGP